ncbi:MAG: BREX-1 system phosphatase PglZ type B, partial [Synechococcaceae cyanobacterium SM2_3_2]|nr:BREX-1 system phosphatase PglZ type B [Synechococcaceae cyanobacterium SM2_3_2]
DRSEDTAAVASAIRSLYLPWLENAAHHLQSLVKPTTTQIPPPPHLPQDGECILFADGLRFDLGQILLQTMNQRSWQVDSDWQWVALPPVTATSKPAISPIAKTLQGSASSQDFRPEISASSKPLTPDRFASLMAEHGIQILSRSETGDPKGKAWTEFGDIDHYGHEHGAQLAQQIPSQLRALINRIEALLEAGWTKVHIITDHGWLLMPGGLPKFTFPKFLTETYWGRCAILRETSITEAITIPWHWSSEVTLALTPGIGCCRAGTEYAHGSISLQECVTPSFSISLGLPVSTATLENVQWVGLRCRITINNPVEGLQADIRRKPADPTTSLADGGKVISQQGKTSLAIEDDRTEGESAVVVLLDAQGTVIHKQATIIGGE